MRSVRRWYSGTLRLLSVAILGLALTAAGSGYHDTAVTRAFAGAKVNGGTATLTRVNGTRTLSLSDDFVVPDAPAPHWQLVDTRGNVYLLARLVVKGDVFHPSITVPEYVPDIAKVQIWCAWAETLLGEAPFERPVR